MTNLLTDHPLSHRDVSREVYMHRLHETANTIVSNMRLAETFSDEDGFDVTSVITYLLLNYQEFFYISFKNPLTGLPMMPSMAMWDLTTLIFDKLFSGYFFSTEQIAKDDIESKRSPIMSGFIRMNDKFSSTWFKNATIVEFNSLYPNIILSIMDKKTKEGLKFNISNFHRIFTIMMNERKRVRIMLQDTNIDTIKNVYEFIKIWINMVYGILNTDKSYLRCNENIGLFVNSRANSLLRNIYNDFEGHILYIDTDFVIFRYFSEVSNRFKKFMENPLYSDIPWTEEKVSIYIEKLKKYIYQDSTGALHLHGFKKIDVC